ncbi:hypothetical protein G7Y89_g15289 [Cudoniella acicularis]|uniref:C2H2-type domain-containing protein n=1 Tax=Cudoniella acicularis TaxID=354080 RepID=A0A8H4VPH5_9HELO|nr:hypothetical protein G7Y89_g15289 [Cudoniella acicularis]
MDTHNLNDPTYLHDSVLPFADFQPDEASEDKLSRNPPAPTTFSSSIDGRYQLNGASLSDTEYIDPALLERSNPSAMVDFIKDYSFPAMQYTQSELSPYHPDWQSPTTDFEQQQQNFQTPHGVPEGAFPNAPDTPAQYDIGFDWLGTREGIQDSLILDHIANQPTGSLAFSQREHVERGGTSRNRFLAPMRCEWPSCKKECFLTKEDFTQHLHHHRDDVRDKFAVAGACQWPGCRSRKSGVTFKTKADFDRHLKLHMKSHWCDVPGCKHGEGFARQHDLRRHLRTHSMEHEFKCPDSSCTSNSFGFSRKDKLDAHIKTRHPHLMDTVQSHRCEVYGCMIKKPFDTIEDLEQHFVTLHEHNRPHLCPVEGCGRHSNGFTNRGKLVEHIKAGHDPPKCTFDHCDFRSLGDVMANHIQRSHGNGDLECISPAIMTLDLQVVDVRYY